MNRALIGVLSVAMLSAGLTGCESKAGTGAMIGGGAGAGLGAIIGHQSGKTGQGALIGGAVGAIGGGLVGNEMDKNDRRDREARERGRDAYQGADYRATEYRDTSRRPAAASSKGITQQDVIYWSERGDRDELIIDRIEQSGATFNLSSRDENDLRDAGVSEDVIRAMKDTARR